MTIDLDAIEARLADATRPFTPLRCPSCGGSVGAVGNTGSLNRDQFDATKAGDWYCETCPAENGTAGRASTGFAYFWDRDVGVVERPTQGEQVGAYHRDVPTLLAEVRRQRELLAEVRAHMEKWEPIVEEALATRDAALRDNKASIERELRMRALIHEEADALASCGFMARDGRSFASRLRAIADRGGKEAG